MKTNKETGIFTNRELDLIKNCKTYAANGPAGLPGHNLMMIISKLSDALNMFMAALPPEDRGNIANKIAKMYDFDSALDPSKVLFGQIKRMAEGGGFTRRDFTGQKRTVQEIAKAQGRDVVYICPDGTIRNEAREIVGRKGELYWEEGWYRSCIPASFADASAFKNWLNEVQSDKDEEFTNESP